MNFFDFEGLSSIFHDSPKDVTSYTNAKSQYLSLCSANREWQANISLEIEYADVNLREI